MEINEIEFKYLKQFILGGRAEIVVKNTRSGNHITYKILKSKTNDIAYQIKHLKIYLGTYYSNINAFTYTPNKIVQDSKEFKVIVKLIDFMFVQERLPIDVVVLSTGRCSVCNRTLKDPEYIKIGIGKYCLTQI